MTPETAILLMAELKNSAGAMHPESYLLELEDIQDRLIAHCLPTVDIEELKWAYRLITLAKMEARSTMI